MSQHLTIARTKGAKAGFKAFEQYLKSPLGANNPRLDGARALLVGSKKDRFNAYCGLYLTGTVTAPASAPVAELSEIEQLEARIAELKAQASKPASKPASKGDQPRVWRSDWVARKNIPAKVGATFTYKSKKYGTTSKHRVIAVAKNGDVTTERISITR